MFIADFHIHSKYSRATSKDCVPESLEMWARKKGLSLIGTGDFTHAVWREELKQKLVPREEGLYSLKNEFRGKDNIVNGPPSSPRFIVSGEISSIYKKNGRVRKVHNLIMLPSIEAAETLSRRLEAIGNLHSDGRPILGLDSKDLLEITLEVCPECIFIPAHIWTPHFSLFGAYSGFDDINECFEDLTPHIYALETGLSSDPTMNWRLSALDNFTLISNSDAHSPGNLAREANLFNTELSYSNILNALKNKNTDEFYGTIEFFPEEGKYHYDGHRNCKVCQKPSETIAAGGLCPVCGGRITVGVLHRAEALADRPEGFVPPSPKHFESLVPLMEVISASTGLSTASVKVKEKYESMLQDIGPELFILRESPYEEIEQKAGPLVAEGIRRLRSGKLEIHPGYDGEYGKVKIMDKSEISLYLGQLSLFNDDVKKKTKKTEFLKNTVQNSKDHPAFQTQNTESDMLSRLNQQQNEAVTSASPAIAVIAGPGTGKTNTLVSRIIHLIEKCGARPSQITAVTFTNKAAGEMRARLLKHFGNKRTVNTMNIGTFHSLCLKILTKQKNNITIIDELSALSIVKDVLKNSDLKSPPHDILRGISLIKNGADTKGESTHVPPDIYNLYCEQLLQYGVLDYDDIILKVLENKENLPPSYLLVDEFQDINPIQYQLIKKWSENSKGIFVIGDPDQSIYGFRGSDPRCFQWIFKDFPDMQTINLTQNYRSTPEILTCASAVISKDSPSLLEPKRESGAKVRLLETEDPASEAFFIANEISRKVGGMDMLESAKSSASDTLTGFSDIAVLYRANRQARLIEKYLLKESIPYTVAGRDDFLSEPEVLKTTSFFKLLLNPADLISLRFCLNETGGYSEKIVKNIFQKYTKTDKSLSSLIGILEETACPEFIELIRKYQPIVRKEKPCKLIASWAEDNGIWELKCIKMLSDISVLHEDMPSLLNALVLGREIDIVRKGHKKNYSRDSVLLTTLHGAKGLEFPVVFLCGVTDGLIPLKNSSGDCDTDEEKRLFYVGITRARDELILMTSPESSPFLTCLPSECYITDKVFLRKSDAEFEQLNLFDI